MTVMKKVLYFALLAGALAACEKVDTTVKEYDPVAVPLEDVARILAALPVGSEQWNEVHAAVQASTGNGYDSEYTLKNLFTRPGTGVGAAPEAKAAGNDYAKPLREWIGDYVQNLFAATKASETGEVSRSGYNSAQEYLNALTESDIQIYWPFEDRWDGSEPPVITFDPDDGSSKNVGYLRENGIVREILVDENTALERPVWVVNRNDDAAYKTLEVLRRENPDWGQGGTIRLKGAWFAGASEFFVKIGCLEEFTASTEAEMLLYSPTVTDFMVVVKRGQVGTPVPFNAVLVSDWTDQLENCAFLITEDDGGTRTTWKCSAMVKINSKSYGFDINIPFNTRDDIVWRGQLSRRFFEANTDVTGHFGDVDLVFEII